VRVKKTYILLILILCTSFLAKAEVPVSLAYEDAIRCFPELKNDSLKSRLDLTILKEVADNKFVTLKTSMLERVAIFTENGGLKKKLRLWAFEPGAAAKKSGKQQYKLQLDIIDAKGLTHEQKISDSIKTNPTQNEINNFFTTAQFESDYYTFIDTKLNGVELIYKRNFEKITEFSLKDKRARRQLDCDLRDSSTVLCECIKK
jgi:Skp family chaperone for outer membrane proteins